MRTLGCDLDGVLYEWHSSVYDYMVMYRNYKGSYNKFWSKDWLEYDGDFWEHITGIDTLYSDRFPTDDCKFFLDSVKENYEIFYITARPDHVKTTTEQYLKRHKFPFHENLIFTKDKVNTARRLRLAYALDDNVKQVKELSKATNAIMIARPWNKELWDVVPTARSLTSALKLMEK